MPGFDGKGPSGQGPMTGRGLGPCNQKKRGTPECESAEPSKIGFGKRGLGRRRGFRFRRFWRQS